MEKKQEYEELAIEVITFPSVDVIVTSNLSTETPIHSAGFF